jgi:hypothetical protein
MGAGASHAVLIGLVAAAAGCDQLFGLSQVSVTADASGDTSDVPPANIVFVTSSAHLPTDVTTLAAGDAICAARAADVGLAGTYVAWLSLEGVAAKERISAARGWVRVDGGPFVDTATDLVMGDRIYLPLSLDERGIDVGVDLTVPVITHTQSTGNVASESCEIDDRYRVGRPFETVKGWTATGSLSCTTAGRLYCFGVDREVPVVSEGATGRRAFVSRPMFDPSSGVASADARCQTDAAEAGLAGSYLALIGTNTASAISRFNTSGPDWVRLDGMRLYEVVLSTGALRTSLNVTAAGAYEGDRNVATGGVAPGTMTTAADSCDNWSNPNGSHRSGRANSSGIRSFRALSNTFHSCTSPVAVYCLEE